jgi:hypothetical protein
MFISLAFQNMIRYSHVPFQAAVPDTFSFPESASAFA